jgi:hypothetical protein
MSSRFRLYALFLSGLGDQTLSDTPSLRSGDGTHGVIESVAREVQRFCLVCRCCGCATRLSRIQLTFANFLHSVGVASMRAGCRQVIDVYGDCSR